MGRKLNGELSAARKEVEAARGMVKQAGLRANPKVDMSVSQNVAGTDRNITANGMLPLELGGRRSARIRMAEREVEVKTPFGKPSDRLICGRLGNVELIEFNNNPPRFPADILFSANCNTVIQDSVQSFFFHPYLNISYLKQIVAGLQAMGYTFVPASVVSQG